MKEIETEFLKEALKTLEISMRDNVQVAFLKVYKGAAQVDYWPVRPVALCNLTGKMHAAAWWDNYGVYIDRADAAVAFVYAAGDIYAVFESGLSFSFHAMHVKSVGHALDLIEAPCCLKYEFNEWNEQTRRKKAQNLIADYRAFDKIPPVDRLFLPWGAVIIRT